MSTNYRSSGQFLNLGEELIGASSVPYSDWVIATEEVDEVGDLLLLDGCDATAWKNQNCPVLLCHSEKALIGNSKRDPADKYAEPEIRINEGRLIARCYHHLDTEDGRKALEWIRKGSINGASVAFRPAEGGLRKAMPTERRRGIKRVIERWNLFEWSIVPTPCNSNTELLRICFPGEEVNKSIPGLIQKHLEWKGANMADIADSTSTEDETCDQDITKKPTAQLTQQMLESLELIGEMVVDSIDAVENDDGEDTIANTLSNILYEGKKLYHAVTEIHPNHVQLTDRYRSLCDRFPRTDEGGEISKIAEGEPTDYDSTDEEEKSLQSALSRNFDWIETVLKRHDETLDRILKQLRY